MSQEEKTSGAAQQEQQKVSMPGAASNSDPEPSMSVDAGTEACGEITPVGVVSQPVEQEQEPAEIGETAEDEQNKRLEEEELVEDLGNKITIDPAIIEKLSQGFIEKFLPALEQSKTSLDEVISSQTVLIETVEQENAKFNECQSMQELTQTMVKAKQYYGKLLAIKKEMANLHDKSGKLKKRAVKLQQQKQKEELQRAQKKEREHERERMLAARVVRSSDGS